MDHPGGKRVTGGKREVPPEDLLLQHVSVGVLAMDQEGRCTRVNPAAAKMFGYTEAELLGSDIHGLLHHHHPEGSEYAREECPFLKAATQGEAIRSADEVLWSKSGQPVHVFGTAMPIRNGTTQAGTVVTLQDGGSLRSIEEQLEKVQQEQTEVLRQRDAAARVERDLVQEKELRQRDLVVATERAAAKQLRMTEDLLLQSEKLAAVGRLAASISHEINNPLEAVTNLLYLIRNEPSISAEANQYLQQAEGELARVSQIVSQTLRFQRAGATPVRISPAALVDSVLSLHQGRLHHRRIQIARSHRQPEPFRCSEGDVRQILNNLVGNAIDAMSKDGGRLTIRTARMRHARTAKRGLRITVSDTGPGISRATAAHIFEPFYTTKGASGSGLGLWISSTLVKRHGGKLSVRSRTGGGRYGGTTFSLFLPESPVQVEPGMDGGEREAKAA